VVSGTRITVESIREKMGAGESVEQIIAAHPRLIREGIFAALSFAAKAVRAVSSAISAGMSGASSVVSPGLDRLRKPT
jgi:uncharacterized protein (DUF433 family)